jgi:single-strand DNA-binding protein
MGYQQMTIIGNLGRDPELKYLQDGSPVCTFSVAVSRRTGRGENQQEKTLWFRVSAWRELAERCNQYLSKGKQVMVVGTIDVRTYQDNAGQTQVSIDLSARDVQFLGSREGGNGGGDFDPPGGSGSFGESDDIPF